MRVGVFQSLLFGDGRGLKMIRRGGRDRKIKAAGKGWVFANLGVSFSRIYIFIDRGVRGMEILDLQG